MATYDDRAMPGEPTGERPMASKTTANQTAIGPCGLTISDGRKGQERDGVCIENARVSDTAKTCMGATVCERAGRGTDIRDGAGRLEVYEV